MVRLTVVLHCAPIYVLQGLSLDEYSCKGRGKEGIFTGILGKKGWKIRKNYLKLGFFVVLLSDWLLQKHFFAIYDN